MNSKSSHIENILVNIFITLLAVSPAFALGAGNKNLLLIGAMCISPYFLIRYPVIIPKIDLPLFALCFMMICFPLVFHSESMRWSTVLYSCLFCMFFMAFARILNNSSYDRQHFMLLIKWILIAYCIVLIIQQFCVFTGLPIFNVSNYSPADPYKLNSLMSEPSHSARIIPILMYLYVSLQKDTQGIQTLKESFLNGKLVWLAFLWPILTMGSSTAFIFLLIVIAKFINTKKIIPAIITIAAIAIIYTVLASENKYIKRVTDVVAATLTFDDETIILADHSASFRIVPTMRGAKAAGVTTVDDWFGHGIDADQRLISPISGGPNEGSAGAFYLWINYGLIVALLFWTFSLRICFIKGDLTSLLIWLLVPFLGGGINGQIIWLIFTLMLTYKFVIKK